MTIKCGLFVRLEAKPGKEQAVADFLAAGVEMTNREATTPIWFALKLSPTTFGVFDAFASEEDRQAHLAGNMAKALMSRRRNAGKAAVSRAGRYSRNEESAVVARGEPGRKFDPHQSWLAIAGQSSPATGMVTRNSGQNETPQNEKPGDSHVHSAELLPRLPS
jgi:quinol monooxygenase YgiN